MLMPSTSLSATARSTVFNVSLAVSVAVLCSLTLVEKAAAAWRRGRGMMLAAGGRATVAMRRTAISVRKDMIVCVNCGLQEFRGRLVVVD